MRLAQDRVKGDVVEPALLARHERYERLRPRRFARPLTLDEAVECCVQHAHLDGPDAGVVDALGPPGALAGQTPRVFQHSVDVRGIDVFDTLDIGVDRIEPEGGERAIRAALPGR